MIHLVDADPPSLLVARLLSSCPQPLPRLLLPAGLVMVMVMMVMVMVMMVMELLLTSNCLCLSLICFSASACLRA